MENLNPNLNPRQHSLEEVHNVVHGDSLMSAGRASVNTHNEEETAARRGINLGVDWDDYIGWRTQRAHQEAVERHLSDLRAADTGKIGKIHRIGGYVDVDDPWYHRTKEVERAAWMERLNHAEKPPHADAPVEIDEAAARITAENLWAQGKHTVF